MDTAAPETLARPAEPETLRRIAQRGLLRPDQLDRALDALRIARGHTWQAFAERTLLLVALVMLVAGTIFFFAANWQGMGRVERVGLAALPHLIAVVAAMRFGLDRMPGQLAATLAAVLIGPALLTYGQAYQSGADAWTLFAGWSALALPFALAVNRTMLWVPVLILMRVGVYLAARQIDPDLRDASTLIPVAAAVVLLVDVVLVAITRARGRLFLSRAIAVLAVVSVFPFVARLCSSLDQFIVDYSWSSGPSVGDQVLLIVAPAVHVLAVVAMFRARELFALTVWGTASLFHLATGLAELSRHVFVLRSSDTRIVAIAMLVIALGVGLAGLMTRVLKHQRTSDTSNKGTDKEPTEKDRSAPTLASIIALIDGPPRAVAALLGEHKTPHLQRPWYVHVALSMIFWTSMVTIIGVMADNFRGPGAKLIAGLAFLALAIAGPRFTSGLMRLNVALAGYAGTTGFLFVFIVDHLRHSLGGELGLGFGSFVEPLTLLALQCMLAVVVASRPVRFKAAFGAQVAFTVLCINGFNVGITPPLLAIGVLFVVVWLGDASWSSLSFGDAVRPMGFASAVAFLGVNGITLMLVNPYERAWLSPVLHFIGLVTILLVVGGVALYRNRRTLGWRALLLVGVGVAVCAIVVHAPALLAPAIVIIVGRMRGERFLEVMGLTAAGIMLTTIYYTTDMSLLWSSGALLGVGAALLVVRALLVDAKPDSETTAQGSFLSPMFSSERRVRRPFAVFVPALLVFSTLFVLVGKKETLRAHGETMYVKLAPLDPRSLLQGDYVELRFELGDRMRDRIASEQNNDTLIVMVDDKGLVWLPVGLDHGGELGVKEKRLKYRTVNGRVVFGAPSYLIPEGTGRVLEGATHAELRVAADGTAMLTGLFKDNGSGELSMLHRTE